MVAVYKRMPETAYPYKKVVELGRKGHSSIWEFTQLAREFWPARVVEVGE